MNDIKEAAKEIFLLVCILLLSQCNNSSVSLSPNNNEQPIGTQPDPAAIVIPQKAGAASFRLVRSGMMNALGITTSSATCNTEFENVKSNLSEKFNVDALSDAAMASVYNLALCYCNQFSNDTTLRANLLPTVNFNLVPSTSISDSVKLDIANAFMAAAWDPTAKVDADVQDIVTLLEEITPLAPQSTVGTRNVVSTACAVVLSSFKAISL